VTDVAATSTRIVLVRHGESLCNVKGVVGGHTGCTGLSETGFQQAAKLRDRLASTGELVSAKALYSSMLRRSIDTARVIAPAVGDGSLEVVSRCDLCELHPGEGDGLTWQEFDELYGEPDWDTQPLAPVAPGGESWVEFVDRASSALEFLAGSHAGELVVVVCHGGIVEASMLSYFEVADKTRPLGLPTAYTSMTEWEREGSHWQLVRYNDIAQLGGPHEAQRTGAHRPRRELLPSQQE
jgi:2,3-bisphosphoglycerate-dependent phosphoglycerate mutase